MTLSFEKPDHPLPQLELPNWLPGPVAEEAQLVYDKEILQYDRTSFTLYPRPFTASEEIKILQRLASDQRMKKVWNELLKKKRKRPGEFLHQFMLPEPGEENPQEAALRIFLKYAWDLATCGIELQTLKQLKPLIKIASRLEQDAKTLRSLGIDEVASNLEAKAIVCRNCATPLPNSRFPSIVGRARGDKAVRAFVLRLSAACREWFGEALTGTVATTASVALSKTISADQVRNMVRDPRA